MPLTTDPAARLLGSRAVVLDLDGTLHDDPVVHDHHIALLQEHAGIAGLVEEVAAILDGRHPAAAPGDVVDVARRLVIGLDAWRPIEAVAWDDGAPVSLPSDLPVPITTTATLRYLGDRWQVAGAVAAVRGVPADVSGAAFATARSGGGPHALVDGAADLLRLLHDGRGLVLASNTPDHLARPLVDALGLLDLVDEVHFGADKPTGTPLLVERACARWDTTPDRVAVIGDNLLNDLLPAAHMGCTTVHIDPWATDSAGRWSTVRVAALTDLTARLHDLAPHTTRR